jgi:hypothetical protein
MASMGTTFFGVVLLMSSFGDGAFLLFAIFGERMSFFIAKKPTILWQTMVNYSKWDNIDSDEDSDEPSDVRLSSSGDYGDKLKLARLRKLDADAVLDTINNRKIDGEVAKGFEDARALYLGSLSALGDIGLEKKPSDKKLWSEARELRLSCHLNIVAGAIQGLQFDIARTHGEKALELQPDHIKGLEVSALSPLTLQQKYI